MLLVQAQQHWSKERPLRRDEVPNDIDFRDTFSSPHGKRVLEYLNVRFNPDRVATDDAHTTAVSVGRSEPIRFINRRVKDGMDGKPNG